MNYPGRMLIVLLSLILVFLPLVSESAAQTPIAIDPIVVETMTSVDFPKGITFETTLPIDGDTDFDRIELFYRPVTDSTLSLAVVDPISIEQVTVGSRARVEIDLLSNFVPSGIDLTYFWRLTKASSAVQTEPEIVSWVDPRFEWTTFETEQIRLHTYHLSAEFALSVAETAQATATLQEQRFGMPRSQPIAIWIYENANDFAAAKQTNFREAVAGASYPGYYVIHIILREGDDREVGRTITHEVSHQCLFQATANPYAMPPLWFDEGLATHAQTAGAESYLPLAATSAGTDRLYKLDSLAQAFPYQPAEAAVAYATSWSAVEFILQRWGHDGIATLIDQFSLGVSPGDAIQQALGISSDELDAALKEWLLTSQSVPVPGSQSYTVHLKAS